MNIEIKNGNRVAQISQNDLGEFQAFIGYVNHDRMSGIDLVDRKVYKRENAANKFCNNWVNG